VRVRTLIAGGTMDRAPPVTHVVRNPPQCAEMKAKIDEGRNT
jgi:hypothetical protein